MPATPAQQAAIDRLLNYYDGRFAYDPQTNPGGFRNGGHRVNFDPALEDAAAAFQATGKQLEDLQEAIDDALAAYGSAGALTAAIAQAQASATRAQNAVGTGRVTRNTLNGPGGLAASLGFPDGAVGEVFTGTEAEIGYYAKRGPVGSGFWEKLSGATLPGLLAQLVSEGARAALSERQSLPKYVVTPRAFVSLSGGALANGSMGFRVPAGQNGGNTLLRVYWDLPSGEVARKAGRPLEFVAELKTSIGFPAAFVGPGGAADARISFTPEGMPAGTTVTLLPTDAADTYALVMSTRLTGTEAQIAANIFISGSALPVTAEASVALNKTLWVARDTTGASDVVTEGDAAALAAARSYTDALGTTVATLPLSTPEMVALSTTRYAFDGGAVVDVCDRMLTIPVGRTGAGALVIAGLPFPDLIAGTQALFRFRFQTSADIGTSIEALATKVYIYGATINLNDGVTQIGAPGASITRVGPGIFDLTLPRTVDGTEREAEVYLGISGDSVARSTRGFILLRSARVEVVSAAPGITVSQQIQRISERKIDLLVSKPGFRSFLTVAADGTGDFFRIRDAVAAIGAGASETERNAIFVKPGEYTDECSTTTTIDPPDFVDIIGLGGRGDVRIIARFPDNQVSQSEIQPFFPKRTCRIANITVIGRNVRYPIHPEAGNSQGRAIQVYEDVIAIHEGATGWGSPTAFGIGQHAGNHLVFRRVEARSPTSAIGFHNNVAWTRPASVLIEDCHLLATGSNGEALSVVSCGAGIMSPVTVRNTTLNGTVRHICTFLPGTQLSAHRANRYEYPMTFDGCTPFDWTASCDVSCLALASVAGASSAVTVSGSGAAVVFGATPDVRRGATDYAAVVYGFHAVDVPAGEVDPGVTLAARLGDRRSGPLTLTVAFDGLAPFNLSLDADYRGMSNADIVAGLNTKLAAALGGNAGGRAFSLAKPYVNRAPIHQPSREGHAINADTATILKGHILVWSGRSVRLMTTTDTLDLFAGIALDDAIPGDRVRFQKTGYIGQPHLLFSGSPTFAIGDVFGVAGTVGRIAKSAAHAVLRVRSLANYGAVFEIMENRFDSSVIEASPANVADFSASDAWADYGSKDFVASGRSLLAEGLVTFFHQNASAAQVITRMRLVDVDTGLDVAIGQSRGTVVENGRQINNVVGMIFGRLVPGRSYSLRLQHYRAGNNGPTQINDQRIQAICVP